MAEGGTLDGPALDGFGGGDISLTAPSYVPPRPRALSSGSRILRTRTPLSVISSRREPAQTRLSHEVSQQSGQTFTSEPSGSDEDAANHDAADLMAKATQPVTGLRMR